MIRRDNRCSVGFYEVYIMFTLKKKNCKFLENTLEAIKSNNVFLRGQL